MDIAMSRRFTDRTEQNSVFRRLKGGPFNSNTCSYAIPIERSRKSYKNSGKCPYYRPPKNSWVAPPETQWKKNPNYGNKNSLLVATEDQLRKILLAAKSEFKPKTSPPKSSSLAVNPDVGLRKRSFVWTRGGASTQKKDVGSNDSSQSNDSGSENRGTQKKYVGSKDSSQSNDSGSENRGTQKKGVGLKDSSQSNDSGSENRGTQKKGVGSENSIQNDGVGSENKGTQKDQNKICELWVSGNCVKEAKCRFLHSWSRGDGFSMLAKLGGHEKAVTGITLPLGSDKLYSGSMDGTVRVWDCHTGQCARVINHGDKIGSLISEGPWVFIGMPNVVKALNIQTSAEFSLKGPTGQVNAMVVGNEMLFAGAQDGVISAWKGDSETNPPQLVASMEGHTRAVICLTVGSNRLYSGSLDHTIRVWDLDTLQSLMTLNGHTDAVMSLLCWDQCLLSCSLDQTIKVWVATEEGNLEVTFTQNEEHGLLALSGMNDTEAKPILFCSRNDNSVHLYELPSFTERGRLFSKQEVSDIQIGPHGLFFTGDGTGMLTVWTWLAKPSKGAS